MSRDQAIQQARTALEGEQRIRERCKECGRVRWFARWIEVGTWLDDLKRRSAAKRKAEVESKGLIWIRPNYLGPQGYICVEHVGSQAWHFHREAYEASRLLLGVPFGVEWADLEGEPRA